ncbi:MAG: ligand-gated channel protein, partial [Lysobacteraceae bacterium]
MALRVYSSDRQRALPRATVLSLALLSALGMALPASAQDAGDADTLDTIEVLGSRAKNRSAAETAAPVDVISTEQLERTGARELGQLLQMLEPSFNFSRTTISDGTDILRPATLR